MARRSAFVLVSLLAAVLVTAGGAAAGGGNYSLDGGTANEQKQVKDALNASSFDWSLVPNQITIHIAPGQSSQASPGQIWLDANLLDAGTYAWGVVQHEYAHQVDFFLLNAGERVALGQQLGAQDWCYGVVGLPHAAYGCERFASTLAWSYWPSQDNVMRPQASTDESAALPPAQFRALLANLLASPSLGAVPLAQLRAHAPAIKAPAKRR
jgi:hypothetical protein